MISERLWISRLVTALGGLTVAGLLPSSCVLGGSSCDGPVPHYTACFTKSELGASERTTGELDAGGEAGAPNAPVAECPATNELLTYQVAQDRIGYPEVESVQENGDSCCYRYFYMCEGRPLVVAEEPILAQTLARNDWVNSNFEPASLDERTRKALADAWARDAAFEHASIASFAQFMLELLSLGAPLELVREAERAIQDEVVHAELCYALASRYAGKKLGPGPLPVPAFAPRSLREIALAALAEGCISETIAAHAARQRLEGATDPGVVAALERIVEDEQRHAELAFRFLAWAIEREPSLARDAEGAFASAIPAQERDEIDAGVPEDVLRAHGVLTLEGRRASAERALERVIAPCHDVLRVRIGLA
jgi:hypothetical protein